MIALSDIAIKHVHDDRYRILSPGCTIARTSRTGVIALLAADGATSTAEACSRALVLGHPDSVGADVTAFLHRALDCGFLYESAAKSLPVFGVERMLKWLDHPSFRSLSEINLCPSTECNLGCAYCDLHDGQGPLDEEVIRRVLLSARDCGANFVNIIGGEPSLFWQLTARTIGWCAELGFGRITVSTNGVDVGRKVLDAWASAGLSAIQISMDRFRGHGKSFEANCRLLFEACDRFPEVSVAYVYSGQGTTENLLPLAQEISKTSARLDLKVAVPFEGRSAGILPSQIRAFLTDSRRLSDRSISLLPPEEGQDNLVFCGAGNCHAFVSASGDVRPCGFLRKSLGNVNDRSFRDIWFDGDWQYYEKPKYVRAKKCLACEYRQACIAGCLARLRSRPANCEYSTQIDAEVARLPCLASKPR